MKSQIGIGYCLPKTTSAPLTRRQKPRAARQMALFLSTTYNRIDRKGRVSVPASFRAALAGQAFQGVVLLRSPQHQALEGFSHSVMETIGGRLDNFDMFSAEQDDLAMAVFGEAMALPFDGEGRVVIPAHLLEYAGIEGEAAFVGMGRKFQIWSPTILKARQDAARANIKKQGLTIPAGNVAGGAE